MNPVYRKLIDAQFAAANEMLAHEGVLPPPWWAGTRVCAYVHGTRRGIVDQFLLSIETDRFPIEAHDIGFLDPNTPAQRCDAADMKDPRFFPFDNEQRFKTAFPRVPRVFVCIEPGFTREYFIHHLDKSWNPRAISLAEIIQQVRNALTSANYSGPMWERS